MIYCSCCLDVNKLSALHLLSSLVGVGGGVDKGVNSMAQDSSVQDSMTNDFTFILGILRIYLHIVYSIKLVSSNIYIYRVNCVVWLLGLFNVKICEIEIVDD